MPTPARRQLLAVVLPSATALLVVGEALTPTGLDKPITTRAAALRELPIARAHSGQLFFSNMLVVFGLGALGVAFCAIATLPRHRGTAIAATAAVMGSVGAFCGAIVNVLIGFSLAAAATAHTTPGAAAQVLVSANTSAVGNVFFAGYLSLLPSATILTVVALWWSAAVPRSLATLFGVGLVAAALSPPGVAAVALSLPFAVAMVLLTARIWAQPPAPAHRGVVAPVELATAP